MGLLSIIFRIGADATGFKVGMKQVESQAAIASKRISGYLAGAFGVAALASFTKRTVEFADQMDGLAKRFEATSEEMQVFSYQAGQTNTSIEAITTSLEYLRKVRGSILAGKGGEESGLLAQLGIGEDQVKSMRAVDLMKEIFRQIKTIDNKDDQGAVMRKLFGRGSGQMLELANEDLDEMEARFRSLGGVIDNVTNKALADLNDQLLEIAATMRGPVADATLFLVRGLNNIAKGWKGMVGGVAAYIGSIVGDAPRIAEAGKEMLIQAGKNALNFAFRPNWDFSKKDKFYEVLSDARNNALNAADKVASDALGLGVKPQDIPGKKRDSRSIDFWNVKDKAESMSMQSREHGAGSLASVGGFFGLGGTKDASVSYLKRIERNTGRAAKAAEDLAEEGL